MGDNVFINDRAVVHKKSAGRSTAFPDVCLCPPSPPAGPVPTPLPNIVMAADLTGGARSVLVEGTPMGKKSSHFARSQGNEVSRPTGGGVASHATAGKALFASHSMNVFIEGEPAVRHMDLLTHNHLAPGAPPNTPPALWLSVMAPSLPGPAPAMHSRRAGDRKGRIAVAFVDDRGLPVTGLAYELQTPAGAAVAGQLPSGGHVALVGLDAGQCRLSLPEVDRPPVPLAAIDAARVPAGTLAYQPGRELALDVDRSHRVAVPVVRTLWLDLPVRAAALAGRPDRFTLASDDGVYRAVRTAAQDRRREGGRLTLAFPGLTRGPRYTLIHETGDDGATHEIFGERTFDDLFPAEPGDETAATTTVRPAPDADEDLREERRAAGWTLDAEADDDRDSEGGR